MIKRLCVICEGQTEETFIHNVIAPFFGNQIIIEARIIQTSPEHKGGGLNYDRVRKFICNTLREDKNLFVTTLFDLYGLPNNFPDYSQAKDELLDNKLIILTEAMHQDIIQKTKCRADRFLAYIQPHEIEALLFANVEVLTNEQPGWFEAKALLMDIRRQVPSPEHINNHHETKPSALLKKYLHQALYRKVLHGGSILSKIGVPHLTKECAFFAAWIDKLRQLSNIR